MRAHSFDEARDILGAKRDLLAKAKAEMGGGYDVSRLTMFDGTPDAKSAQFRDLLAELNDASGEFDFYSALKGEAEAADLRSQRVTDHSLSVMHAGGNGQAPRAKSFREILGSHKDYQAFRAGSAKSVRIEFPDIVDFKALSNLVDLSVLSPQAARDPEIQQFPAEYRTISDMMVQGTIDRRVMEYWEITDQTDFTSQGPTAEGADKQDAEIEATLRTDYIEKISETITVTDEDIDDMNGVEQQLNGILTFLVVQNREWQLINGDGSTPNISGILDRANLQTQDMTGADNVADAIFMAMQKVRGSDGTGFAEPTGVIINPADYTTLKLLKAEPSGIYLYNGGPAAEGVDRVWGLPLRQTTSCPPATVIVGAFRPFAVFVRRSGVALEMSRDHADYRKKNKVLLIGEERVGLKVLRPSAFCVLDTTPV